MGAFRAVSFLNTASTAVLLGCTFAGCTTNDAAPIAKEPIRAAEADFALQFDGEGTLETKPNTRVDVGFRANGAEGPIALWLDGDYGDASLSAGSVDLVDNRGVLTLRTPSMATTFTLHARSANGIEGHLDVAVSSSGFASLAILPAYVGKRLALEATASAFVRTPCADLLKQPLRDGSPSASTTPGRAIRLNSIPAGERVAIVARVRFFAVGCIDIEPLAVGGNRSLSIPILDRPLSLDVADFNVTFAIRRSISDAASLAWMQSAAASQILLSTFSNEAPEATVLLDGMAAELPSSQQVSFGTARANANWNSLANQWFAQRNLSLRDITSVWLAAGADNFAWLRANIRGSSNAPLADAKFDWIGRVSGTMAFAQVSSPFSWTADGDDVVHVAGTMTFSPVAAVAAAADLVAGGETQSSGVGPALATKVDCAGFAAILATSASIQGCNSSCLETACADALSHRWLEATKATAAGDAPVPIIVHASGKAVVGDHAEPLELHGDWVGDVQYQSPSGSAFALRGAFDSQPARPHTP